MSGDSDPGRDAIHDAIQANARLGKEDGAILTGWALVTEWMDPQGGRWLSKGHSAGTTKWAANGMLHEALYGDWPDGD